MHKKIFKVFINIKNKLNLKKSKKFIPPIKVAKYLSLILMIMLFTFGIYKVNQPDYSKKVYAAGTVESFNSGNGTKSSPYLISNITEYDKLANNINCYSKAYKGKYFKLTADIDLGSDGQKHKYLGDFYTKSPYSADSSSFEGYFDGNGYSITLAPPSLMEVPECALESQTDLNEISLYSLFPYITGPGIVENLTVKGNFDNVSVPDTGLFVGGVVGIMKTSSDNTTYGKAGGIYNCTNEVNYNLINVKHSIRIGGIVGQIEPDSTSSNPTISKCINNGKITIKQDPNATISGDSSVYGGGIAGLLCPSATINISQCINNGTVILYCKKATSLDTYYVLASGICNASCSESGGARGELTKCISNAEISVLNLISSETEKYIKANSSLVCLAKKFTNNSITHYIHTANCIVIAEEHAKNRLNNSDNGTITVIADSYFRYAKDLASGRIAYETGLYQRLGSDAAPTNKQTTNNTVYLGYEYCGSSSDRPFYSNDSSIQGVRKKVDCLNNVVIVSYKSNTYYKVYKCLNCGKEFNATELYGNWTGSGTSSDPYKISNINQLLKLSCDVSNGQTFSGKYFKLTTDLDFSQESFKYELRPIGVLPKTNDMRDLEISSSSNAHPFSGNFDGGNHTITITPELYGYSTFNSTNNPNNNCAIAGIFGYIKDATIKNLKVTGTLSKNYLINNAELRVGGGVVAISNSSHIENVSSTIDTNFFITKDFIYGGIVGLMTGKSTLKKARVSKNINIENYLFDSNSINVSLFVGGAVGATSGIKNTMEDILVDLDSFNLLKNNKHDSSLIDDTYKTYYYSRFENSMGGILGIAYFKNAITTIPDNDKNMIKNSLVIINDRPKMINTLNNSKECYMIYTPILGKSNTYRMFYDLLASPPNADGTSIVNSYYNINKTNCSTSTYNNCLQDSTFKADEALLSGLLAYKLGWGQDLSNTSSKYPSPMTTGYAVYELTHYPCPGELTESANSLITHSYSNTRSNPTYGNHTLNYQVINNKICQTCSTCNHIAKCYIKVEQPEYTLQEEGEEITPCSIEYDNNWLITDDNESITIVYNNNATLGTATASLELLGNRISETFEIVDKKIPNIHTAPSLAPIYKNEKLKDSTLTPGVMVDENNIEVPGTFSIIHPETIMNNVEMSTVDIKFTPTDTTKYKIALIPIQIEVKNRGLIIAEDPIASSTYQKYKLSTSTITGGKFTFRGNIIPGTIIWNNPDEELTEVGTFTKCAAFIPNDLASYDTLFLNISVEVKAKILQITEKPIASSLLTGDTLEMSILEGGKVFFNSTQIIGTFEWENKGKVMATDGTTSEDVIFTPSNTLFDPISLKVNVLTQKVEIPPDLPEEEEKPKEEPPKVEVITSPTQSKYCRIYLYLDNGKQYKTVKIKRGSTFDKEAYTPIVEGYKFNGWYQDKDLSIPYNNQNISRSTILYAKLDVYQETKVPEEIMPQNPLSSNISKLDLKLKINDKNATLNNNILIMDVAPTIYNGRTFVPIRFTAESFNANVSWNAKTKEASLITPNKSIVFDTKNMKIYKNNIPISNSYDFFVKNGRIMVPIRFVAENYNLKVDWINKTKTVIITGSIN